MIHYRRFRIFQKSDVLHRVVPKNTSAMRLTQFLMCPHCTNVTYNYQDNHGYKCIYDILEDRIVWLYVVGPHVYRMFKHY